MVVDKIPEAVVKDLIPLVNSLGNLPKTATVKYGATNFSYVPLDDIMAKSSLYTLEEWNKRPWLRRVSASILRLGAIWL